MYEYCVLMAILKSDLVQFHVHLHFQLKPLYRDFPEKYLIFQMKPFSLFRIIPLTHLQFLTIQYSCLQLISELIDQLLSFLFLSKWAKQKNVFDTFNYFFSPKGSVLFPPPAVSGWPFLQQSLQVVYKCRVENSDTEFKSIKFNLKHLYFVVLYYELCTHLIRAWM